MSKIEKADGSEMTIWHYRVAKQHERNQAQMEPQEMLYNIAIALRGEKNQFSIIQQKTKTPVSSDDIDQEDEFDISKYASSCTTPRGDTATTVSTTLLICITNNHDNAQHNKHPIDDLAISMQGKWHICPDRFCGLRSGMIGVFTEALPDGVNWSKTARTIAEKLAQRSDRDKPLRVEVRPARFSYNDSTGRKTTTLVAVYAPRDATAEVKGICSQIAFDSTDKAGLGLAHSQFHSMKSIHSRTSTRDYILERHVKRISNYSTCTISADTCDLDDPLSAQDCKEFLASSFANVTDIQSYRDLMYAILKHEYHADYNNIQAFEYPSGDEGFKITATQTKMHTVYEAIIKFEEVAHHFATSSFSETWPAKLREYIPTSEKSSERIAIFTRDQKRDNNIRKEANRPPPTSYATAAVPQTTTQPKVNQTKPQPVKNQNDIQIPSGFENMCTSMSSLCKQTCNAIKQNQQQQPALDTILAHIEEQSQENKNFREEAKHDRAEAKHDREEAKRDREDAKQAREEAKQDRAESKQDRAELKQLRQIVQAQATQLQAIQQQLQQLASKHHEPSQDEQDDESILTADSHDDNNEWLAGNIDTGAVEESKDEDDQEETMVSSTIVGDARNATCAAASTSTSIREYKYVAPKSKASAATSAAKVARVDWRSKTPPPSSQRVTHSTSTDTKMTDHYNKRPKPQSPPTTPNNVSALVPVAKKNKNVKFKKFKSGPSNSKASQGRS